MEETKDEYSYDTLTPLMRAAKNLDMNSLVENIAYNPSTLNAQDHNGWTALMYAANSVGGPNDRFESDYSFSIIKVLLKAGADTLIRNHIGENAIDVSRIRIVKDLIKPYQNQQIEERQKILLQLGMPSGGLRLYMTEFLFRNRSRKSTKTRKSRKSRKSRKTRKTRKNNKKY